MQIAAEVVFACRHEYAESAVDVIARRLRLSFLDVKVALQAKTQMAWTTGKA